MKKFIKEWQGIISTAILIGVFCVMPKMLSFFSPNSGTIDFAYLQALSFSTMVFFSAVLCSWIAIQCDWKIFTDSRSFRDDWRYLTPFQRTLIMQGTIMCLILFYILCFFALPKP